jgi:hypothetical protein
MIEIAENILIFLMMNDQNYQLHEIEMKNLNFMNQKILLIV